MRNEILRLLEKGKEVHDQLISAYDESLPAGILHEGNNIVAEKLPGKINGILAILNADARSKKYPSVTSIQQAIEVFKSADIQKDIDKAIANKELVGLSDCEDCFITIQEMLDGCKRDMQSLVEELNRHAITCKTLQL